MTDYKKLCEELQAENERLKKQLDAAVADMEYMASDSMCDCCLHNNPSDEEDFCDKNTLCYGCNKFKWRERMDKA